MTFERGKKRENSTAKNYLFILSITSITQYHVTRRWKLDNTFIEWARRNIYHKLVDEGNTSNDLSWKVKGRMKYIYIYCKPSSSPVSLSLANLRSHSGTVPQPLFYTWLFSSLEEFGRYSPNRFESKRTWTRSCHHLGWKDKKILHWMDSNWP